MGGLKPPAAIQADARFEAMLNESFSILLPDADGFSLAKRYLGRFETGLRAGDALHLAITKNDHAQQCLASTKYPVKAGRSPAARVKMQGE